MKNTTWSFVTKKQKCKTRRHKTNALNNERVFIHLMKKYFLNVNRTFIIWFSRETSSSSSSILRQTKFPLAAGAVIRLFFAVAFEKLSAN